MPNGINNISKSEYKYNKIEKLRRNIFNNQLETIQNHNTNESLSFNNKSNVNINNKNQVAIQKKEIFIKLNKNPNDDNIIFKNQILNNFNGNDSIFKANLDEEISKISSSLDNINIKLNENIKIKEDNPNREEEIVNFNNKSNKGGKEGFESDKGEKSQINDNNNVNYDEIDSKIEKYFINKKNTKNINFDKLHSSSYHVVFDDDQNHANNKIVTTYFNTFPNFSYGISVSFHTFNNGKIRAYFYGQIKGGAHINKRDLNFCKITNYNLNVEYIVKVLKKEGNIIYERGDYLRKGGINYKDIFSMSKEKRENLSKHYSRSCKLTSKYENSPIIKEIKTKEVKVFYIKSLFKDGSCKFVYDILYKRKITFNNIRYYHPFWSGIDGKASVAIFDRFNWEALPISQFQLLINDSVYFFNTKESNRPNLFTKIYLFGNEDPENIYPDAKDFRFIEIVKCLNFYNLRNSVKFEEDLGFC